MENNQKRLDHYSDLYWDIVDAVYLDDYKVKLWFYDGSIKVVDLEERLFRDNPGTVFMPLRDKKLFATVRLDEDLGTITWENGADLAPEYLYESGVDIETVKQQKTS